MTEIIYATREHHSPEYNRLKDAINALKNAIISEQSLHSVIAQLEKDADELESLRLHDMRDASGQITRQNNELRKRHEALLRRLAEAETRLQAVELATQGPGTFIRKAGYYEVQDVLGQTHQIPLVDVRDQRGVEGRVAVENETIDVSKLQFGQRLLLLGTQGPGPIMGVLDEFNTSGREASVVDMIEEDHRARRVIVTFGDIGEGHVCWLADNVTDKGIGPGSRVLVDPTGTMVVGVLPEKESSRYLAAEIPTTTFADIGGLDHIAAQIEEDFIWPLHYFELFKKAGLPSPRGCLLSGPPGTGKTMVAKATANLIAQQIEKTTGKKATSQFLYIKGPELLNKYVGETERGIREIFKQARKLASETTPVVIFIDEMDALFLTRGHGISSDVNLTIVPQFTAEMDGLEDRGNVIVIGATNRRELIDPAVIRPGRCDKIFEIPRPDAAAAKQIFAKYLLPTWDQINSRYNEDDVYHPRDKKGNPKPETYAFRHDPRIVAEYLINRAVQRMYDPTITRNEFIGLTFFINGERKQKILRYGDLASGALIANIVERAKKRAIHDYIVDNAPFGVEMKHLYLAIEEAFDEQRTPKTIEDVERWLMIQGHAEGPLAAPPVWIDHSKDTQNKTKKELSHSPTPVVNVNKEDTEDEEEEEF